MPEEVIMISGDELKNLCSSLSLASRNLAVTMREDREALLEVGSVTLASMSTSQHQVDEALAFLVKQAELVGIQLTADQKPAVVQ